MGLGSRSEWVVEYIKFENIYQGETQMKLTDQGGTTFENPEPGSYAAVSYKLVDIGTQQGEYQGKETFKRQIIIGWEISELMKEGDHAGKPFVVSKFYTASLGEKANLRKDLIGWRGRDFTPEELRGFEDKNLLDKPCMLSLTLNDKGKIRVSGVSKLPKGMIPPKRVNEILYFSLEPDKFVQAVFDAFSDNMKAMIKKSPEYQAIQGKQGSGFADMKDDIPADDDFQVPF